MTRGHKNTKTTAQGHSSKTFYKCIAKKLLVKITILKITFELNNFGTFEELN